MTEAEPGYRPPGPAPAAGPCAAAGAAAGAGPVGDPPPRWFALASFDVPLGLAVMMVGALEAIRENHSGVPGTVTGRCLVAIGIGAAVGLHRRYPGLALLLAWVTGGLQLVTGQGVAFTEIAIVIVAYGTARYGSAAVIWASLLSVPAAFAIVLASPRLYSNGPDLTILELGRLARGGVRPEVVIIAAATVVLGLPWLVGFALRMRDRAVASQAASAAAELARAGAEDQRAQAQRLAEVRAEQTRLARDVHDVVGHSLAVILAQAQSGDFLSDDDPERLKQAMRNIADSARASLRDVRRILAATSGPASAAGPGDAGPGDAGPGDAGPGDAGPGDAGPGDAGPGDAGPGDAGPGDAGPGDAGPGGSEGGDQRDVDARAGDLDRLLDDVRTAGLDIQATVTGTARPLPPDLAIAVYRVMQEMLTNTIKHGAPDAPVYVRRDWTDGLTIEVSSSCPAGEAGEAGGTAGAPGGERWAGGGLGLDGMRQRLAAAGGTLTVTDDRRVFTARAWLPLPGSRPPGSRPSGAGLPGAGLPGAGLPSARGAR